VGFQNDFVVNDTECHFWFWEGDKAKASHGEITLGCGLSDEAEGTDPGAAVVGDVAVEIGPGVPGGAAVGAGSQVFADDSGEGVGGRAPAEAAVERDLNKVREVIPVLLQANEAVLENPRRSG